MITWIDVSLGIEIRYSDIKDVPVPPDINRLFDNESTTNMVFIKCEAVIEKLAKIQGDLRFAFISHQTQNALREEEHTIPKIASNDSDQHQQYCQNSLANSSLCKVEFLFSFHRTTSNVHITTPRIQVGGLTDTAATARNPSHTIRQVAYESPVNPVEDEVSDGQQAMQANLNLESYLDLHSRGKAADFIFL
ncbi:unnamed protein product [Mytilus edulis]|uniref:Uncharacterized protein n=1 Tax=Mytilus edulis TaxID=6550 RepID=A0A8S3V363_MYTED|nr:unnamed protein product [Mytilus edulis]